MKKYFLLLMLIVILLSSCSKTEDNNQYVTYDTDGGEPLAPQLITDNLKLMIPDKEGYVFLCWKDDDGNYVCEENITSSIHLTAEYERKRFYLIIVYVDDASDNTSYDIYNDMDKYYTDLIINASEVKSLIKDYSYVTLDGKPYDGTDIVLNKTRKLVLYK